MPILILSPRYTADSVALWQAAVAEGWDTRRLQGWRVAGEIEDRVAVYGEHLFAIAVADQLSLALLRPPFDWLARLPFAHLKRSVWFAELAAMARHPLPAFIKPADDKSFAARVYEDPRALPDSSLLPPQTPILIAEPVVWEVEFRCFVLNRSVVTASVYSRGGHSSEARDAEGRSADEAETREALSFMQGLLADPAITLPPSVVVDVGIIQGRGWAVVEANPSWGSGIYGCDPRQVLYTVARGCRRMAELTDADRPWVTSVTGQSSAGD
jgi:hypothetical protein